MESLQSLSARVLAKNDFNENFFHKKLMCHWEIRNARKQEIFDEFSVYENFCLEIEDHLDYIDDLNQNYYLPEIQWIYFVGNKTSNEFIDFLEYLNCEESKIKEKEQKKESMEEKLIEKLSKIERDEEIDQIRISFFDVYFCKDYSFQIRMIKKFFLNDPNIFDD